ncbi:MAG TPA: hypothetical protein PKE64_24550 [Anaerolineae bacterium]|nr:hypothetical protein [Anaerolineae bacterium]HMR67194.1 hypothetical protein [Anaerolineae bacterium]
MSSQRAIFVISSITLLLLVGVLTACSSEVTGQAIAGGIQVRLLVQPPTNPLPVGSVLNVRSLTESETPISHIELYALQLPSDAQNVLIRADAPALAQTNFTAMQRFTPQRAGNYVLRITAYNQAGQKAESNPISFTVE